MENLLGLLHVCGLHGSVCSPHCRRSLDVHEVQRSMCTLTLLDSRLLLVHHERWLLLHLYILDRVLDLDVRLRMLRYVLILPTREMKVTCLLAWLQRKKASIQNSSNSFKADKPATSKIYSAQSKNPHQHHTTSRKVLRPSLFDW